MDKKFLFIGGGVLFILILWIALVKGTAGKSTPATNVPAADVNVAKIYTKAQSLEKNGDYLKAKTLYQDIVKKHPDYDDIASVQKNLETLNMDLIFSATPVPGKTVMHEVVAGDTLGKIAKKYNTTVELIKKSNHLNSDVIRLGQKLRIWTGQFNIFVDKSQNILILKDGNDVVKVYQVSTGENNCTPVGTFKITSKLVDPVWFNRGIVVPPESPENVLGTRWLGLDIPGYGIHGTVDPDKIGQQVTAGCVRMLNKDVEQLYSLIPLGTEVVIVD